MLPPSQFRELRSLVQQSFARRTRLSLIAVILSTALCAVLWVVRGKPEALQSALLLTGIGLFTMCDYSLVISNPERLAERAMFAYFIRTKSKVDAIACTGLMLLAGLVQIVGQHYLGAERLITNYGAYFAAFELNQSWRLISGPLMHSNLAHWLSNTVTLVLAAMVIGTISRRHALAMFLGGSIAGVLAAWHFSPHTGFEAYLGISSGVSAMLGFCVGFAWRRPEKFPAQFAITLFSFSALEIYLAWVVAKNACNEGHITGLAVGILWGLVVASRCSKSNSWCRT